LGRSGAALLVAFLAAGACSPESDSGTSPPRDGGRDDAGDSRGDVAADGIPDRGDDSRTDPGTDPGTDGPPVCDENRFEVAYAPTRLMILLDDSGSMNEGFVRTKWEQAKEALTTLLEAWAGSGRLVFGFDVFPDFECVETPGFCCDVTHPVVADCEPDNEAALASLIASTPAPTWDFDTPLCSAIDRFNDASYAPRFTEGDGERYLVVVSDGEEECNGTDYPATCGAGPTYPGAVSVVTSLLSRGIRTLVIGFGSGVSPEQLGVIAAHGGTAYPEYFVASDGAALQAAFESIASEIVSCEFDVDWDSLASGASRDPALVNFYCKADEADPTGPENIVPFDDGCADGGGWTWVDEDTVAFCEAACNDLLLAGRCAVVAATFGCESILI
jgi:hypothetical protein